MALKKLREWPAKGHIVIGIAVEVESRSSLKNKGAGLCLRF
jgi:hypothetical protein